MSAEDAWSQFWSYDGISRTNPPSETGLAVGKHVGEDPDTTRVDEELGFLIIEAGSGVFGGVDFVAAVGPDIIQGTDDGPPAQYAINPALSSLSAVIATQTAMDGTERGWAVVRSRGGSSFGLVIEEDQCSDTERLHTTEQVAYLVFCDPLAPLFADGFKTGDTSMWSE